MKFVWMALVNTTVQNSGVQFYNACIEDLLLLV